MGGRRQPAVSGTRDPYEVLGVSRSATTGEIRTAYLARARRAHPDLVGNRGTEVMRALNEAWAVLKDEARRSVFDSQRVQPAPVYTASAADAGGAGAGSVGARPFWHGAMGRPPGRPSGPVLEFGIYAGWSIGEIAARDRGYMYWLRDRPEAQAIREEVIRLIDPGVEEAPQRAGRRR